jgi:hypothetical protein
MCGDEGKQPESWPAAELRWPARPSRDGNGLMHLRRRGVAERVCLGERMLLVASIGSVGAPSRRIDEQTGSALRPRWRRCTGR